MMAMDEKVEDQEGPKTVSLTVLNTRTIQSQVLKTQTGQDKGLDNISLT